MTHYYKEFTGYFEHFLIHHQSARSWGKKSVPLTCATISNWLNLILLCSFLLLVNFVISKILGRNFILQNWCGVHQMACVVLVWKKNVLFKQSLSISTKIPHFIHCCETTTFTSNPNSISLSPSWISHHLEIKLALARYYYYSTTIKNSSDFGNPPCWRNLCVTALGRSVCVYIAGDGGIYVLLPKLYDISRRQTRYSCRRDVSALYTSERMAFGCPAAAIAFHSSCRGIYISLAAAGYVYTTRAHLCNMSYL